MTEMLETGRLEAAVAAYDAEFDATRVPARALFAAALELDVPVAEALNELLAAGALDFLAVHRPGHHNAVGVVLARL